MDEHQIGFITDHQLARDPIQQPILQVVYAPRGCALRPNDVEHQFFISDPELSQTWAVNGQMD